MGNAVKDKAGEVVEGAKDRLQEAQEGLQGVVNSATKQAAHLGEQVTDTVVKPVLENANNVWKAVQRPAAKMIEKWKRDLSKKMEEGLHVLRRTRFLSSAKMSGSSGRVQDLSCFSGMTEKFVMRVQEETLSPVMSNAVCHAESATRSSANISHAWQLCMTENSLLTTQHYKLPGSDIFAIHSFAGWSTCSRASSTIPALSHEKSVTVTHL